MSNTPVKQYALVTGGTGGLGLATAQFLVTQGWKVYVADSNQQALNLLENKTDITPLLMDVTQSTSIQSAFDTLQKEISHLDAIINFAGILRIGSMAEMSEQTLALLMDINVMGTFRVNQIFFPLINTVNSKKQKGRIINISSETGWQSGAPFNGAYAMSKHAIEAYSDALRRELQLLDIPVIKIQPGPFKTNMVASIEENFAKAAADSQFFSQHLTRVKNLAMNEQNKAHPPLLLAQVIYQALSVKKPKAAYSVKPDLARSFLEYLPTALVDWILKKVLSS
jgi:NAD(P)-dependent dehydrogenase (short-subunit alcohol dehydrogenase family)